MKNNQPTQLSLSLDGIHKFPNTRYQGSKAKLTEWISESIKGSEFNSVLDVFGGTGAVSYQFKKMGKRITYNDILKFNSLIGKALIENFECKISNFDEIDWILSPHDSINYPNFIQKTFPDIYFTDDENKWIDQTITNIRQLNDPYKYSLAFFALCQTCIVKRPYNLFHRKNLYIRFADVKRSFGNKSSWDKPPEIWFRYFLQEANQAVFDNGRKNNIFNLDALKVPGKYDLVYIDTPYITSKGTGTDYLDFYHFLEGLANYDQWESFVDFNSKHRRFKRMKNNWVSKHSIHNEFSSLFKKFKNSILLISYRSDGIPSITELREMLSEYKENTSLQFFGKYKYALSKNSKSKETLIIGS